MRIHLKEDGDTVNSVILVGEKKEKEESEELYFWCTYFWIYYYVKVNYLSFI